jgi:hypothetical protein
MLELTPNFSNFQQMKFHTSVLHVALLVHAMTAASLALAADDDAYHYQLTKNNDPDVCQHMYYVYSNNFKYPFRTSGEVADYSPGGKFALPLLPGVKADGLKSMNMMYSLQPSSPEFDAIKWHEGHDEYDAAIMVTDVDINNDGKLERVIKHGFMGSYYDSKHPNDDDIVIFTKNAFDSIKRRVTLEDIFKVADPNGFPAVLAGWPINSVHYRILRPFIYKNTIYLSGYGIRGWSKKLGWPLGEHVDIVKYVNGGGYIGKHKYTPIYAPIKLDLICAFNMKPVKQ